MLDDATTTTLARWWRTAPDGGAMRFTRPGKSDVTAKKVLFADGKYHILATYGDEARPEYWVSGATAFARHYLDSTPRESIGKIVGASSPDFAMPTLLSA